MNNNIINSLINMTTYIDFNNINMDIINQNINLLESIFVKLQKHYNTISDENFNYKYESFDNNNNNNDNPEHKFIINQIKSNFLAENKQIQKIINNIKYIGTLQYENIKFYWISDKNIDTDKDKEICLKMFNIAICLNKFIYGTNNDTVERIIIWIPINKKRDFNHQIIDDENLNNSVKNFEAFTASGLTYNNNNDNSKITIVTRYEEVEKLLIHELIHNYNIDGSEYYNNLTDIVNRYKIIKNKKNKKDKKNYDYSYSIFESYTELLSTYLYLLFLNIDTTNHKLFRSNIKKQIIIELLYSYNLICNLIRLNEYKNYEEFLESVYFKGDICIYEYYFIKALMYNNYFLELGNNIDSFRKIYNDICGLCENINNLENNKLLKNIYEYVITHSEQIQTNYKYIIY